MKSNHTPGPWKIQEYDDAVIIENGFSGPVRELARVFTINPVTSNEDHANARLIAAAPDLLESCRSAQFTLYAAILDLKGARFNYIAGKLQEELRRMEAAVAKATDPQ